MNKDKLFFRNIVLHYFDLKIPLLKTHKISFECYKDDSPLLRTFKYWCSCFNDLDFSDKPRASKPQKISDKETIKKVKENPTIAQRKNATHFNVSQPAIFKRLKQIELIQNQNIIF